MTTELIYMLTTLWPWFYMAWVYWSLKLDYFTKNTSTCVRDKKGYTYCWYVYPHGHSCYIGCLPWQEEKCPLHLCCQNCGLARNIHTRYLIFIHLGFTVWPSVGGTYITNYYWRSDTVCVSLEDSRYLGYLPKNKHRLLWNLLAILALQQYDSLTLK